MFYSAHAPAKVAAAKSGSAGKSCPAFVDRHVPSKVSYKVCHCTGHAMHVNAYTRNARKRTRTHAHAHTHILASATSQAVSIVTKWPIS